MRKEGCWVEERGCVQHSRGYDCEVPDKAGGQVTTRGFLMEEASGWKRQGSMDTLQRPTSPSSAITLTSITGIS